MEQECKLELNGIDREPVVEDLILPDQCLTLEKINTQRGKRKDAHKKRGVKRADSEDEDDVGAFYADEDGYGKGDDNDDERDEDEDKRGDAESQREQDDEAVSLNVAEEELEVKTKRASNTLAATKNVAQGMMDIALITANANQLRYILAYNKGSSTYLVNIVLVSTSLILQVSVGMCLILKGKYKKRTYPIMFNRLTNFIVIGVFLITIINVFIASFTVTTENTKS